MKSLKPSMREKKRYLYIKGKNLKENIEDSILDFIGVLGASKIGLSFIRINKDSAVICINRESLNKVRACFAVWPEKIEVLKVSGTIKGLNKK